MPADPRLDRCRARYTLAHRHLLQLADDAQRSPSALVRAAAAAQIDGAAEAVRRAAAALADTLGPQGRQ